MKQSLILWISALIITFLVSFAQDIFSPDYPVSGTVDLKEGGASFSFDKVVRSKTGYKVWVISDFNGLKGKLFWRDKSGESPWQTIEMKDTGKALYAVIPQQTPMSQIEYRVKLFDQNKTYLLPVKTNVSLTFLNAVPDEITQFYFITLFAGLIFSVRTALESFSEKPKIKKLTVFTAISFFSYTFVFNTVKKSVELGAIGKGALPLSDIFDQRSILLFAVSILTLILIFNTQKQKLWASTGAFLTLAIFLFAKY
ncbi:MAG: hypothetical protein ACYCVH_13610 [Ignavibacteriaceae bacterium]